MVACVVVGLWPCCDWSSAGGDDSTGNAAFPRGRRAVVGINAPNRSLCASLLHGRRCASDVRPATCGAAAPVANQGLFLASRKLCFRFLPQPRCKVVVRGSSDGNEARSFLAAVLLSCYLRPLDVMLDRLN